MIFGKLNISGIVFFVSYIFEMIEEKRREEKRREEKRSSPIPIYLYKKYKFLFFDTNFLSPQNM